jgi:hypothetical protein
MAESPLLTMDRPRSGTEPDALIGSEPMPDDPRPVDASSALAVGTDVDVRTGFDRSWAAGFEVAEVTDVGYRLRRTSDRTTLPAVFPFEDVRRHRSSFWWV